MTDEERDILAKAWNKLMIDLAEMFRITKLANWISDKLNKL